MRALFAIIALIVLSASPARAAEQPLYRPAAAWVRPIPIPPPGPDAGGAAQILLQNVQTAFGEQGDVFFQETAVRIQSAQGLSDWGNVIIPWRPDTETLTIHRLAILRGSQTIDLLAGGKTFTVLRRETNLEMAMLDGTLTATFQPEGLQVGDVLDVAYSRTRRDPALQGRSEDWSYLARPGVVERAYFRLLWPRSKPVRWKAATGLGQPILSQTPQGFELVVDMPRAEAPPPPRGAPRRFANLANLQASDFAGWSDVSALMQPLYAKAATLRPASPLHDWIARIRASSADPKVQAAAALTLVEEQVRYVSLGLSNGGYVPADADATWTRRFGDCKAKTALLLALLDGLGIEAEPALVSTEWGDGLDERLPSLDAFDHVAVRARIGGKVYWLDPTRIGDRDIDSLTRPDFHWMLPVRTAGAALEPLRPDAYAEPHMEERLRLDATAGLDMPAAAHVEHIFRGDEGLAMRRRLEALTRADLDRAVRAYFRQIAPWIEPKATAFARVGADVVLSLDGSAALAWSKDPGSRVVFIDDSNIGLETSFQRDPGPNREAPFAVNYPAYVRRVITVALPNHGAGFLLVNAQAVDKVVAGTQYRRTARLEGGVATIEVTARAVSPEFAYGEADKDAATLRAWTQHAVGIRQNAAMASIDDQAALCLKAGADSVKACQDIINRSPRTSAAAGLAFYGMAQIAFRANDWDKVVGYDTLAIKARSDLAGAYNDRGAAYARQGRYDQALADYDQAIRLQPSTRLFWINRSAAHASLGRLKEEIDDLDHALAMDPKDAGVLVRRAWAFSLERDWDRARADFARAAEIDPQLIDIYLYRARAFDLKGDTDLALEDLGKALELRPKAPEILSLRSDLLQKRGDWALAVSDLDQAVRLDPQNGRLRNDRCWARAQGGLELDLALADCNEAIAIGDAAVRADALESRGLIYVRRSQLDRALTDYEEALNLEPRKASALYMRGLIRRRLGDAAQGDADIARAQALAPQLEGDYARIGIGPDSEPRPQARADAAR